MKLLSEAGRFLLYGNIFIAACASALSIHTDFSFGVKPEPLFVLFVFLSTLSCYNLHAYYNPQRVIYSDRSDWVTGRKILILLLSIVSGIGALYILFLIPRLALWALPLAALTLLYSAPRIIKRPNNLLTRIIYWKTLYLAIIWTIVTFALPVLMSRESHPIGLLAFGTGRFLFLFQICMLFEHHDKENSKSLGLKILMNRLSDNGFSILFMFCSVILQLTSLYYLSESNLTVFLSILLPELSLVILYRKAMTMKSDIWYNLVIDGHLLLPAIILYMINMINSL
jgi:hypothetical protein